jgi:hypothetical protein
MRVQNAEETGTAPVERANDAAEFGQITKDGIAE